MNTILWALQVVLAIKFVSVVWTHGLRPDPAKMQRGREWLGGAAGPLLGVIALAALVGAAALVAPGAVRTLGWLVPWAAAAVAGMMLIAAGLHLACREKPNTWVALILAALAALLAYGRWAVVPL